MATSVPTVPVELTDHIIDYLHDDKQSLRSCSLVCRLWMPASSFHLFWRMKWPPCTHALDQRPGDWEIVSNCRCALADGPEGLTGFLQLLRSVPRIHAHVRELHIRFSWFGMPTPAPIIQGSDHLSDVHHPDSFGLLGVDISGFEPGRYVRYHHVVKTTPAGLMDIVNVLPALQCLDLHGDPFDPALPSPPHHSVQASRDLDNLCLSGLQEDTGYEQLSQFLQCFQRIRVLALDDLSWNHLSTPGIHVSGPFPSVNTLKLDENALSAYWISAFASMLDLRSLFVLNIWDTAITWDGLRATHDLVSRCTSLTALTCSCFNTIVITQCPFPCSTLRLLHFRGECTFNGLLETTESPWRGIAEVMGSPLTISVNELVVDFTIVESTGRNRLPVSDKVAESRLKDTLASLGWRLLDDLLPRLRSLKSQFSVDLLRPVGDGHRWRSLIQRLVLDLVSPRVRQIMRLPVDVQVSTMPHCLDIFPSAVTGELIG